jgi:acyl-homoserine lactone synthase
MTRGLGMIHVVTAANRHLYESELHEQFRIRHDVYVGERGWKALARVDGLERDQFDDDGATYILSIEGEHVIGGSRLVPTTRPNLLSDVFPHLAAVGGVPCDPAIFEWTRIFVIKERREGRNSGRAAGAVICGILEFCLAEGIEALTAVMETWWLPRFHDMEWTLRPLGLPEMIDGEWTVAVLMPITERTLETTRAFHNIEAPVLVRRGPQRPAITEVWS